MNTYLKNEARWAREQALSEQAKADTLRDPVKVERMRRDLSLEAERLKWRHLSEMREMEAKQGAVSPEEIGDTIARHDKDARYWRELAEGHEARLAGMDDAGLFEETR